MAATNKASDEVISAGAHLAAIRAAIAVGRPVGPEVESAVAVLERRFDELKEELASFK